MSESIAEEFILLWLATTLLIGEPLKKAEPSLETSQVVWAALRIYQFGGDLLGV